MKLRKVLAGAMALVMAVGAIVVAPVNAEAAEADTATGLVGYYTFDDTLKNAVSEDGTAKLHGGAGNTWLSPATGTATYVEGVNGKAYSFTGDVDGVRGEGLELDAKSDTSEATISAWIDVENFGVGTSSMIFGVGTVNEQDDACFSVNSLNGYNGSVLLGKIWDWDNRNDTFVCLDGDNTGDVFALDKGFVHVTITVKEGEQKLYLNGEKWAESTSTNALVYNNLKNTTLFLGINWWDASFGGAMDDVAVYNRALTAEDVAALYAKNGVPQVPVEGINLDVTEKNMVVGDEFTLTATTSPAFVTVEPTITWSSSDETIATVENGKVTAVKAGTATITASVSDTIKATCEVTISNEVKPLTAIDVTADKTEIELNAKANLTVTYNPEDTTDDKAVTWSTSDEKVATVKDGVVTAVGYGKATITAKVGELTDTVEITVLERPATALDVKADKTDLKVGETATITTTVTPEDTTDAITYESSNGKVVTVDNGKVTAVGAGSATVTVTAGDITKEIKFTVTETSKIELGDLAVDGFWTAHTAGIEIVAGKTYTITLDAKSTDSTNAWNCPVYVVYTNSAAKVDNASADYKEYLVCRADNWAWTGDGDSGAGTLGDGYKFETIAVPDSTDWVATYKEAMAAGAEGKITAVLSGKNLVVTFNIAGVESKATIPVDTSKPLYISLTGEKVEMEDITAVVKTIPAKGDFSPVLPIALVVLGGAVVVVASKKRFA